jgi:ParB-like chromosome segregation protein Spo0J
MAETFRQDCLVDLLEPSPELIDVQALMPIDQGDKKRLRDDIESSGIIRDPIKVYKNGKKFFILGGYNRWVIARDLGFDTVPVEIHHLGETERKDLVIKDNLNRRHLTGEQKRNLIAYFLKEDPALSDSAVSKKTGATDKTVGRVRRELESTSEIPRLEKRKGADGKVRKSVPAAPARKAAPAKAAAAKQKPEVDFKKLARDYHFDLSKVKGDIEKIYREYQKLAQKHNILAEKLLKKKDKEKGLLERERARIYSEVSKKLGSHFVFLRELLK